MQLPATLKRLFTKAPLALSPARSFMLFSVLCILIVVIFTPVINQVSRILNFELSADCCLCLHGSVLRYLKMETGTYVAATLCQLSYLCAVCGMMVKGIGIP